MRTGWTIGWILVGLCLVFAPLACGPVDRASQAEASPARKLPIDEPATDDEKTPPTRDPGPDAEGARITHSTDPAARIVWMHQTPGYVPEELARRYMESPYCFALYGDGTVIYRSNDFQHYRVLLGPEEMQVFLRQIVATGFLDLEESWFDGANRALIIDAQTEAFGVELNGRKNEYSMSGITFHAERNSENRGFRTLKKVRELLARYAHPRAESFDPRKPAPATDD